MANCPTQERLITFIKSQGLNVNRFEKICGLSTGYVSNIRKDISREKRAIIVQHFPNLNPAWLATGEGDMLRNQGMNVSGGVSGVVIGQNNYSRVDNTVIGPESIDVLKAQIEILNERLKEKDEQIREKDSQIRQLLEILSKR